MHDVVFAYGGCTSATLMNRVSPRLPRDSFRGLPREVRHLIGRMRSPEPEERPHDGAITAAFLLLALLGAATLSSRFGAGRSVQKEAYSDTFRSSVVHEDQSPWDKVSGFVRATPGRPRTNKSSPVAALSTRLQASLPSEKGFPIGGCD